MWLLALKKFQISLASINVTSFSVLLYRLYFAPKTAMGRMVRQWPSAQRPLNFFKTILRRCLLPKTRVWLQVQKGLTQGMWMRLGLPDEARYWRGEHELEVERALSAAIYQGAVVYDVGAHLGYFALGAARLVGKSGRVIAFDGDPDNVVRLRENVLKNDLEGCLQVIHAAVWSSTPSDGISFRRGVEPRAQGGVEADGCRPVLGNGELIKVPAIALDAFIARGEPCPDVIKIDVEGGEYEVLLGAVQLFSDHRPLLIAEVHHIHAAEQIGRWLEKYRYCAKWNASEGPRQLLAWPAEYDGQAWMQRFEGHHTPVAGQLT
jgi:FkbM family methyltransferase